MHVLALLHDACIPKTLSEASGAAKNPGGSHDLTQPHLQRGRGATERSGIYDKSCLKFDAEQFLFRSFSCKISLEHTSRYAAPAFSPLPARG